MGNYRAIASTCQAVVDLLDRQYRQDEFKGNPLEFRVMSATDFEEPPTGGVTLFLYHISQDTTSRTPPRKGVPSLPLNLHFILTPWGKDAGQEQRILGWALETLNEHPVLTAAELNAVKGEVFAADEKVEVVMEDLTAEQMQGVWAAVSPGRRKVGVGFCARIRLGG